MATFARRRERKQLVHPDVTSYTSKQNLWQKLCQMLCGIQSPSTTDFPDGNVRHTTFTKTILADQPQNGVFTHGYTDKNGGQFDGCAYGGLGVEFEVDFKQPGSFGRYDPDANSKAVSNHKSGQSLPSKRERNDVSLANENLEDTEWNKIDSPEKPVHRYSPQKDFIKEAINNNGKYNDPDPPKAYSTFEAQSEGKPKERKSSESQTKKISGSFEQAGLPSRSEKQKDVVKQPSFHNDDRKPSFNGDHKYIDIDPPNSTMSSFGHSYADIILPKTIDSSVEQQVVRQTTFKDNKYADISPPITTTGSIAQQVIRQPSFKDNKYADASPPIMAKGSVALQVVRQLSFKDNKYADTSPSVPTKGSSAQQVARQTSFEDNKYANNSAPLTAKGSVEQQFVREPSFKAPLTAKGSVPLQIVRQPSFKDNRYADTSPPITAKGSVALQVARQPIFKDNKYADYRPPVTAKSSVALQVVRQTSFKDNKYADTSPPIPTERSVAQQIVRQTSFKDDEYADTSSSTTTRSSIAQHVVTQTSLKDSDYADTNFLTTTKSSFMQDFVRQSSFNNNDEYSNTKDEQNFVRQASFSKDDKYKDTNHPAKTSKGSVGHTLLERQKVVPKPENNNQNQGNTRPGSSMFTNFSSLGQGVQYLAQKSVAKPEDTNKDDKNTALNHMSITKSIGRASKEPHKEVPKRDNNNEIYKDTRPDPTKNTISGSGQQATVISLSNQPKGIHMEEEINTKDKFGFSNSFVLKV